MSRTRLRYGHFCSVLPCTTGAGVPGEFTGRLSVLLEAADPAMTCSPASLPTSRSTSTSAEDSSPNSPSGMLGQINWHQRATAASERRWPACSGCYEDAQVKAPESQKIWSALPQF